MLPIPGKYSLVAGAGEGNTQLNAFDKALLNAGVGNTNLIKITSILPPGAEYLPPEKLQEVLKPGALLPAAFANICSHTPGEVISAAVAVGIPADDSFGVIMEYSTRGEKVHAEAIVRSMVEEAFKIRGKKLAEIKSIAVEHEVDRIGSAFAAVVLIY